VAAVAGVGARRTPGDDAAALIASARNALGGDQALNAVSAFAVTGSYTIQLPAAPSYSYETSCVLPDKFVRIARHESGGPMSFAITDYDGFNGDTAIHAVLAPNAPFPVTIPGPAPATLEEAEARRLKQLDGMKRLFHITALPLFVTLPSVYALHATSGGRIAAGATQADVISFTRTDGMEWRLLLDATSHLPIELRWKAKPVVTRTTTAVVRGGGPPPPPPAFPAGDPQAGLADVEWVMSLRDYKVADGLNWPRRMTTTMGGKAWEDRRVSRYRINPPIDPKVFETPKSR